MKMKPQVIKVIYIIVGSLFLLFFFAYLIFDKEWARRPFYLMILIVSLYNFFFNRPKKDSDKE